MIELLKTIRASFSFRLALKILFLVIAGTVVSGAIFYVLIQGTAFGPSYGGIISSADTYKAEILKKSLYVYVFSTALMLVGIVILGIIYSHRVAGPLQRVKAVSRDIASGKFDVNVKFRKNDLIHPIGDSINRMTQKYGSRYARLREGVGKMQKDIYELETAMKNNDRDLQARALFGLLASSEEVEEILSEMKL